MKDWIRFIELKWELNKIEKKHKAFQKTEKYQKLSNEDKYHEDQAYYQIDYSQIWEEMEEIKTKKFIKKIKKYGIPYPTRWTKEGKIYWQEGGYGTYYLTTDGYYRLRSALREEKKLRREAILGWIPLITAIGGLLGIATAILTVVRYWNK